MADPTQTSGARRGEARSDLPKPGRRLLRSTAMTGGLAAIIGAVAVVGAVSAGAAVVASLNDPGSQPAAAPPAGVDQAIRQYQPTLYWPLTDAAPPGSEQSGNDGSPLNPAGAGAGLGWQAPDGGAHLAGGQYLRTDLEPMPSAANAASSVVLWFRADPNRARSQVLMTDAASADGFWLGRGGRLKYGDIPGTGFGQVFYVSPQPLTDGGWHMVAFVDTAHLYLDGDRVADGTGGWETTVYQASWPKARFVFGGADKWASAHVGTMTGNLAYIATFARPLSDGQVTSIWNPGGGIG